MKEKVRKRTNKRRVQGGKAWQRDQIKIEKRGKKSKDKDGRGGRMKREVFSKETKTESGCCKERECETLLTTIISDGSKVMHSQPRLPPSCFPKLWREQRHTHTHNISVETETNLRPRKDNSHTLSVVTDAVNHIRPPTCEHRHYRPLKHSNFPNQRGTGIKCKTIPRLCSLTRYEK